MLIVPSPTSAQPPSVFVATWRRSPHTWPLSSCLCEPSEPASSSQMLSQQWGPKASLSLSLLLCGMCEQTSLWPLLTFFLRCLSAVTGILCHRSEDDALCQKNLQLSINTHTGHKVRVLHMQDYSSVLSLYSSKCVFLLQRRTCMFTWSTQKWNQALVKMQTLWRALINANRRWMKESHFLLRAEQELVWKITEYGATQAEVKIICPLCFPPEICQLTSWPPSQGGGTEGGQEATCLCVSYHSWSMSVYLCMHSSLQLFHFPHLNDPIHVFLKIY